ncbi:unnamed protein product [Prunus brigantina]
MHVEKNVFDTLIGTILDIEGKTKDTIKARLDLERMGIRRGLWMNRDSDKARRDLAFFSMKPNDKKDFLKFISSVKFPDGFFSQLTAKTLRKTDIHQLRHDIVQVLCKFEMIFPPAFFTSMIHVMVHLPEEALLAGPVNYRWMYPIESEELYNLAFGPIRAELFSSCHVNGVKFLGTARDDKLCTQNSGVHVPVEAKVRTLISMANSPPWCNYFTKTDTK